MPLKYHKILKISSDAKFEKFRLLAFKQGIVCLILTTRSWSNQPMFSQIVVMGDFISISCNKNLYGNNPLNIL